MEAVTIATFNEPEQAEPASCGSAEDDQWPAAREVRGGFKQLLDGLPAQGIRKLINSISGCTNQSGYLRCVAVEFAGRRSMRYASILSHREFVDRRAPVLLAGFQDGRRKTRFVG